MQPEALLAIRSDIASAVEAEYLAWLTREHTLERVAIEGFVSARIFRSQHDGFGRYLILYDLADETVVDSAAYLQRLDNPTPWTTRMMPHLGNFVRGGGRIVARSGAGCGAALIPVIARDLTVRAEIRDLNAVSGLPGVASTRILQASPERTSVKSNERRLRSGDQSFHALLMIEALDAEAALRAMQEFPTDIRDMVCQHDAPLENAVYSLLFHLSG
jgi:hypothetical protein